MDMWRLNKILLIFIIFIGCNNHPKKTDPCNPNRVFDYVLFDGFKKINKIIIQNKKQKTKYLTNEIIIHENKILRLSVDNNISTALKNNCNLIIDDSLFYTITDVKFKKIERFGMWGSVGYFCYLDQYKLNDSLIKNQQSIVVFKKISKKEPKIKP